MPRVASPSARTVQALYWEVLEMLRKLCMAAIGAWRTYTP